MPSKRVLLAPENIYFSATADCCHDDNGPVIDDDLQVSLDNGTLVLTNDGRHYCCTQLGIWLLEFGACEN